MSMSNEMEIAWDVTSELQSRLGRASRTDRDLFELGWECRGHSLDVAQREAQAQALEIVSCEFGVDDGFNIWLQPFVDYLRARANQFREVS